MDIKEKEKKIQELVEAVLVMSPNFWDNPNGGYENTCPFCSKMVHGSNLTHGYANMSEIKHETSCAYLIAKDLQLNKDQWIRTLNSKY